MNPLLASYPSSVMERFKKFHAENPAVWRHFQRLAFQMKGTGRKRYSAYAIFQVVVWHIDIDTTGDAFKVNHDYIPIYIRCLIFKHPEFEEFFSLRRVRSKGRKSEEELDREEDELV